MRLTRMLALIPLAAAFSLAAATPSTGTARQKWYERAVKKVSAEITPAEAKPGQTVTFSLTVELNDGFHTYPTVQTDKMAVAMVNVFKFPEPGAVIFVGELENPKNPKTKADEEAGIKQLKYYHNKVTYTRKAVVSPAATTGPTTVKLTAFKLSVCEENPPKCYPQKDIPIEVPLKVLDGGPVEVEKAYADEVRNALGK